jgi:ATP-dependent protease HslVU (ClpYQ) peptidase subunit
LPATSTGCEENKPLLRTLDRSNASFQDPVAKRMSTIVAVKKADSICIAADTLTCLGPTKESERYIAHPDKIIQVNDSYIAIVGHASWQLVLASYFANPKRMAKFRNELAIFETLVEMHQVLKEKYYLDTKEEENDAFESSQLDALVANPHGIFGIYSLRSVQAYTRFYARGTGAHYALGAMFAAYDAPGRTAEEIARIGIEASAEFDDGTSLPWSFRTLKIRKRAAARRS